MGKGSTPSRRRWWIALSALIVAATWAAYRRTIGRSDAATPDEAWPDATVRSLAAVRAGAGTSAAPREPARIGAPDGSGASVTPIRRTAPAAATANGVGASAPSCTAAPAMPATSPVPTSESASPPAAKPAPATAPAEPHSPDGPSIPAAVQESPYGPGSALPLPDGSAPSVEYTIKGNGKSMLFHTPTSPYFGRTKAGVWFRTAEDARRAGFTEWTRKPRSRRSG